MMDWKIVLLNVGLSMMTGCSSHTGGERARAGREPMPPSAAPSVPRFSDEAGRLGLRFVREHGGSGRYYYPDFAVGGGALFDYDGDGWLDAYIVQGAPLPGYHGKSPLRNGLYRNLQGRLPVI